jgi:hypothetical protein
MSDLTREEKELVKCILRHSPRKHISADELHELIRLDRVLGAARIAYTKAATDLTAPSLHVEVLGQRVVDAQRALLAALDLLQPLPRTRLEAEIEGEKGP